MTHPQVPKAADADRRTLIIRYRERASAEWPPDDGDPHEASTEHPASAAGPGPEHFFDLIDRYALANKLVLLAVAGGEHHALVLEHALRPLFGFFQAMTVPVALFASSGDFDGTMLLNPRVHGRIRVALTDVADLLKARASSGPPTGA